MPAPGHVRHHGRGELVIGPSLASAELTAVFAAAGIPTQVSDAVNEALWTKLIVNCAYNALSAIAQLPYGRLIEVAGVIEVMFYRRIECEHVQQRFEYGGHSIGFEYRGRATAPMQACGGWRGRYVLSNQSDFSFQKPRIIRNDLVSPDELGMVARVSTPAGWMISAGAFGPL